MNREKLINGVKTYAQEEEEAEAAVSGKDRIPLLTTGEAKRICEIYRDNNNTVPVANCYITKFIYQGNKKALESIFDQGQGLDLGTTLSSSLVMLAIRQTKPEILELFLRYKSIVLLPIVKNAAMRFALIVKLPMIIKLLIDRGIDINGEDESCSYLTRAVQDNFREAIILICNAPGIDMNARDYRGRTVCAFTKSPDIFAYLLHKGANPNLEDGNGNTPLSLAMSTYSAVMVNYLLMNPKIDLSPNIMRNSGFTFVPKLLLESRKRNIDLLCDGIAENILGTAIINARSDIVELMLRAGANPNAVFISTICDDTLFARAFFSDSQILQIFLNIVPAKLDYLTLVGTGNYRSHKITLVEYALDNPNMHDNLKMLVVARPEILQEECVLKSSVAHKLFFINNGLLSCYPGKRAEKCCLLCNRAICSQCLVSDSVCSTKTCNATICEDCMLTNPAATDYFTFVLVETIDNLVFSKSCINCTKKSFITARIMDNIFVVQVYAVFKDCNFYFYNITL